MHKYESAFRTETMKLSDAFNGTAVDTGDACELSLEIHLFYESKEKPCMIFAIGNLTWNLNMKHIETT